MKRPRYAGWRIFLLLVSLNLSPGWASSSGQDLASQFANPPSETRIIKIIHNWPDSPPNQEAVIRRLIQQGFGGVVCNVSFENYLEREGKWQAFIRAVEAAKRAGLVLWLYDEKGYPSGNAGGMVMRERPEWQARGLLIADAQSRGGRVSIEVPPGRLRLAAAYPMVNGVANFEGGLAVTNAVSNGKLVWEAPVGQWHVLVMTEEALFEATHADLNLHERMPYPNLLLPEVTERFLKVTHGEYARRLGSDLGRIFEATFTDEPSLMSCFLRPMPYRPLPWAQNLADEFRKRRGYDLTPLLPLLVVEAGSASQKTRHDYWLTIAELVAENFFGQIQEWCSTHHIPSGGHLLSEENILTHVPFYGDLFRCTRRLDAPSIDILTSLPPDVPWHIARLAASAAELEGKTMVMSETSDHSQRYRPPGDKRPARVVTEEEIRGTCNRIFVSGVNSLTSYYSYDRLSDGQIRRLNEWVGRCGVMLRGGRQSADIAVLYPIESIWACFVPSRQWANDAAAAAAIGNAYRSVSEILFAAQRDFTYVDAKALAEAKVQEGQLVHGQLSWRVVVLPRADTLPLAAWENLAAFAKAGGVVIALGALPLNTERDFPSVRARALGKEIFGAAPQVPFVHSVGGTGAGVFLPDGAEPLLVGLLNTLMEQDVTVREKHSPLRVTHRQRPEGELYFVINDSPDRWQGELNFRATGAGEQWDPSTGRRAPLNSADEVSVNLGPHGGAFFLFKKARTPKWRPLKIGPLPGIAIENLPPPAVTANGGEFVKCALSTAGGGGWKTSGTITKKGVDTYLFLRLQYDGGFDFSKYDSFILETTVPENQRSSTQILVILHEKDGSDYLAESGRSLAQTGQSKIFLPLTRFGLAGWSQDENGRLDLDSIEEIRIGWGGYYGREGEQIEFTLLPPRATRLN